MSLKEAVAFSGNGCADDSTVYAVCVGRTFVIVIGGQLVSDLERL
jgi:hypothetical protein